MKCLVKKAEQKKTPPVNDNKIYTRKNPPPRKILQINLLEICSPTNLQQIFDSKHTNGHKSDMSTLQY